MRWLELFEDDRMPNDKPSPASAQDAIAQCLAEAKRRGYRLPGEPTQWEDITPTEIIRRAKSVDTQPSAISIEIPAGATIEQIVALMSGSPDA